MSIRVGIPAGSVSRLGGGLFTSVRRLSESLAERPDLEVNVFGNRDEYTQQDLAEWKKPPVVLRSSGVWRLAGELTDALRSGNFDIVHPQFIWLYPSLSTLRWSRSSPAGRYLISPRGMLDPWALRNSAWKKKIAGLLFEGAHLRRAACIHALNELEAQAIRAFGLKNPICVIPNGVDINDAPCDASPPWDESQIRGRNVLLFISRIHPKKGLAGLVSAWAALKKAGHPAYSDWALAIAGWDQLNHTAELQEQIRALGLDSDVYLIGPVHGAQKLAALRAARGFVLPSKSEGLPIAVLEAWAQGLPVAMTPECNLPRGFSNGAAVDLGSTPQSLESGLADFLAMTDAERREMGASGKSLAAAHFDWRAIAGQMHDVYRWTLGGGAAPEWVRRN